MIKQARKENPSTSPWTAQPDGSRWRDSRLIAEHLPRDLVRPSSGMKELAQTMKKKSLLKFATWIYDNRKLRWSPSLYSNICREWELQSCWCEKQLVKCLIMRKVVRHAFLKALWMLACHSSRLRLALQQVSHYFKNLD